MGKNNVTSIAKAKVKHFYDGITSRYTRHLSTRDGWTNPVTGMGIRGKDKNASTFFRNSGRLDRETLDALERKDGLARSIIHTKVDDALRQGWTVTFTGDEENPITPQESSDFNDQLTTWYKETKFKARVSMHLKQARQSGGGVLALGVADGQTPDQPLDLERVKSFTWLRPHDRHEVSQSTEIESDPSSKDFGNPEHYILHSNRANTSSGDKASRDEQLLDTRVHASRLWRTEGNILSERVKQQSDGWGDSVLEPTIEPLKNYNSGMQGTGTIIQDLTQGVYKVKNLIDIIMSNGEESVRNRFGAMDYMKSIYNAILIDADGEDYSRQTTQVTGLPDLIDRNAMHLSAVSGMPMTLLFGQSPSGFGTGEAEGDNWDDKVKAYQTETVEPLLEYVLKVLFSTEDFKDFPKDWAIKFTALQMSDPKEEAEIRLLTSQADALDVTQTGSLAADEVAHSRYGGAAYSTETSLNEEARQQEAELLEAEGLAGLGEQEALNGIQIASMLEIAAKVRTEELSRESAKIGMSIAFPQLLPDQINGYIDAVEITGPVDPVTGVPFGNGPPQQTLPAAVAPTIPDDETDVGDPGEAAP